MANAIGTIPSSHWSITTEFNVWTVLLTLFLALLVWDQVRYQIKKQNLPGPKLTFPLLGAFFDSLNPTFKAYLSKWESGPLSCVSVFHKFVVIASTNELSRKILNSPHFVEPCVVDAGRKILKPTNWVFLDGKAHVDYRKGLNGLFTRKALGIYLHQQEQVYDKAFQKWLEISKEGAIPFATHFRDVNVETSLRTFCGNYITNEAIDRISANYWKITVALELVNFPIVLPYSKVWYAIQARKEICKAFEQAAQLSRSKMLNNEEPSCMMDRWIKDMISSPNGEQEGPAIRDFTDDEISCTFLSFLFASQDATSSAMTWVFQYLADHSDVFEKVRQEQISVRDGDLSKPVDMDMVEKMDYTRWMVKEVLRLRPPVLMVPYKAKKTFRVTSDYIVSKGTMLIPTFWHSLHDENAYPDPHTFNPERWGPEGIAEYHPKNFLVFGTGPHYCLGQQYAIMHLMICAGKATLLMDWKHERTPSSEDIKIFCTTYPEDWCRLQFLLRK